MKNRAYKAMVISAGVVIIGCTACGTSRASSENAKFTDNSNSMKDDKQIELLTSTNALESMNTYETSVMAKELITYQTKFREVEAVECPTFWFEYPADWSITGEEVNGGLPTEPFGEVVTVSNDRGVKVTYMQFNTNSLGARGRTMRRYEVSKIADADFVPTIPSGTDSDYSSLGKFIVAKIKVTGELQMDTEDDYTAIDGEFSYALLPESYIGVHDYVQGLGGFYEEFSFEYPSLYAFIAESPDGFTDEGEKEVIAILASFRDS